MSRIDGLEYSAKILNKKCIGALYFYLRINIFVKFSYVSWGSVISFKSFFLSGSDHFFMCVFPKVIILMFMGGGGETSSGGGGNLSKDFESPPTPV